MKEKIGMIALCFTLMATSCKETPKTEAPAVEEKATTTASKYTLTPFSPSTEYADAAIDKYGYKDGRFSFDVSGTDYKLGEQTPDAAQKMCANSGKGQHIHLIIDNEPYAAKYEAEFEYAVADGEHNLLAFLSRSYHESIKTEAARVMQTVKVEAGSITKSMNIQEPIIFYSRPKGTYVGEDTKKVMLDFYLGNIELGDYKVEVDINGDKQTVDKWQPYYIEGMPMGENTITLTVLDKEGKKANVLQNPVARTFTLTADPMPEN